MEYELLKCLFGWYPLDIKKLTELFELAQKLNVVDEIMNYVEEASFDKADINSYIYAIIDLIFERLCDEIQDEVDEEIIERARDDFSPYINYMDSWSNYDSIDGYDSEKSIEKLIEEFKKEIIEKYGEED